jgi:2',3'-cyclic-nucleotide 2'-phosphodiesterase (5'-nucleotidase family)
MYRLPWISALRFLPLAVAMTTAMPLAAQERVALKIAATTDVHGRLRGWDYVTGRPDTLRGLTRAATIIDSVRAANPGRVVLVDAGDLLQGNAMTYVAGRVDSLAPHPVVTAMNAMQYDAAAVGNHEFNYGLPLFDRAARQARFPFLAANTRRLDGGRPYPARTMVTRAGVKVAIIGATTPGSMIWDTDNLRGRLEVTDIVAALPSQVAAARAEGADVVIVVAHAGLTELSSYDTTASGLGSENPMARVAREVAGIDAIVIGHSHREVTDTTINGVLVVQPRNWATSVAVATLEMERRAGKWAVASKRGETVQVRGQPERADLVRALDRAHRAAVRYSTSVIGRTAVAWPGDSVRLRDTPLIDLIQAVQLKESGAELSIASALSMGAAFEAGPISVERLVALYPYENTLRALRLSGAQVRAFLEYSARFWIVTRNADGTLRVESDPNIPGYNYDMLQGLDYTIDLSQPMGRRITSLTRQGRPVADTDSFTVAINNYRAGGGGGYDMLRGAPVVYEGTRELRELIIEEIRRRGTIEPSDVYVENWRILPPRPTLRVIGINDVHGAFTARPDGTNGLRGGLAELAGSVRDARDECAPVCTTIHLNGGDLFTGTPASDLAFGRSVVPILNAMGTHAIALGNHEFDYGQDTLRARLRELRAPVLGVNVTDTAGRDAAWVPDDTIITLEAGVKVGVIGIADPATPRTTRASYVADLRFLEPAQLIRERAAALRGRGARRVLLVAHLGGFCERNDPDNCRGEIFELARAVGPGTLDAIVSGHTHSEVRTVIDGTPIVQARSSARAIGIIDIPLDGPMTSPARPEVREVIPGRVRPDSTVAALVAEAEAAVAGRIAARIGSTAVRWPRAGSQYALGNLIADAQRASGRGDIAFMNNGGIRAELRAGEITWGSLFEIQPFDNRLVAMRVSGAQLRRYIEGLVDGNSVSFHVSGATIEYAPVAPAGARVRRVVMGDGRPLNDRRMYRVVMSDFMAGGGDGAALSGATTVEELNVPVLDALIAHLQRMPERTLVMTEALQTPRFKAVP